MLNNANTLASPEKAKKKEKEELRLKCFKSQRRNLQKQTKIIKQ